MAQLHTSKGTTVRTISRPTTIAIGAVAAVALAAPAFAAPTSSPTSLTLHGSAASVKVHTKDTFTATLTSKGKALAAQTVWLQERTAPTSTSKTTWTNVTSTATDTSGKATFSVTPPIASHKSTQKDQYRAVYKKSTAYGGSHSEIVTVTVKRA